MAYYQTQIQIGIARPEKIWVGEPMDKCYICDRQLNGEQCLKIEQDNILICFDQGICDAYSKGERF